MPRKKVALAFIEDDTKRKASYRKRKTGLLNKVMEISTLCDVDACAILYGPTHVEPQIWPKKEDVQAIVARFNDLPEYQRTNKMMNQENLTQMRAKKMHNKCLSLHKQHRENKVEMFVIQRWMAKTANPDNIDMHYNLDNFDMHYKGEVGWTLNRMLRDISHRMDALTIDALKINPGYPSAASFPGNPSAASSVSGSAAVEKNA